MTDVEEAFERGFEKGFEACKKVFRLGEAEKKDLVGGSSGEAGTGTNGQ